MFTAGLRPDLRGGFAASSCHCAPPVEWMIGYYAMLSEILNSGQALRLNM
jgi:hypothetical protein